MSIKIAADGQLTRQRLLNLGFHRDVFELSVVNYTKVTYVQTVDILNRSHQNQSTFQILKESASSFSNDTLQQITIISKIIANRSRDNNKDSRQNIYMQINFRLLKISLPSTPKKTILPVSTEEDSFPFPTANRTLPSSHSVFTEYMLACLFL